MKDTKALGMIEFRTKEIQERDYVVGKWQLIIIIIVSFVCILFEQNKTVFHFVNEKNEGPGKFV